MATNPGNYNVGTTVEMFKTENAGLLLIDYDADRAIKPIKQGGFVVQLVVHALAPVLITTCMVGTLQWPFTKDSPVIRVGRRSYVFGMPGIIYGLLFPEDCTEDKLAHLDIVFMQFGHFEDHSDWQERELLYCKESEVRFWMRSWARFHSVVHAILAGYGHLPGKSIAAAAEDSSGVLKAFRLSSATHLVGQAILSGALAPQHIGTQEPGRAAREMESQLQSAMNSIFIFPSITVFTSLVGAMEMVWVVALGRVHLLRQASVPPPPPEDTNFDCRMWKLSEYGLLFFLKVMTRLEEIIGDNNRDGVADDNSDNDNDDDDDGNNNANNDG